MSQSLTTAPNVHPSGTSPVSSKQYVVAGVVVLEMPDSHPAPEGAVGLGSQKSKDERGPPHQGANGYHEDFLCLSTRYREPSSPLDRIMV